MPSFISGVVEGFYGRPWAATQRHRLFGWMRDWGLTSYLYAPKDDVKHRTRWRLRYTAREAGEMGCLVADARRHGIACAYALGPGLDLEHSSDADARSLQRRAEQLLDLGVRRFALLFDDIAPHLSPADRARFHSVAAAQAWFSNRFFTWLREREPAASLWFCPTPYCGRMCTPSVRESAYLRDLGELLAAEVDIFWTGPEIVSETIPEASIRELQYLLRRPPLIWDNLHANDYDLRRIYLGPYSGRPARLKSSIRGVMLNPNCEFELNFMPLHTLASWARFGSSPPVRSEARSGKVRGQGPLPDDFGDTHPYSIKAAWSAALTAWTPEFATLVPTLITTADIRLLADCFHLPYSQGPQSQRWERDFAALLGRPELLGGPVEARVRAVGRAVQKLFDKLTALTNRDLLYSLYRHVWELKEEVGLMHRYLDWLKTNPPVDGACFSSEHRLGTYRGGLAAELQRLLPMTPAGGFDHRRISRP